MRNFLCFWPLFPNGGGFGFYSSEGLKGGSSSPTPAWLAVRGKAASMARGARDQRARSTEGRWSQRLQIFSQWSRCLDRRRREGFRRRPVYQIAQPRRGIIIGAQQSCFLLKLKVQRIPLKLQTVEAISEERSTEVTGVRKMRSRFLRCKRRKDQGHNSGATPASLLTGATIGVREDFGTCFSICVI
ncbi:hypothetical protein U1Q18_025571 [Sarracenia purpurea var. burkii]